MKQAKFLSAALLAAVAVIATPAVNAATVVKVLGAGSSAMWQTAAIGAFNDLAGGVVQGAQHYTVKGSCPTNGNCAQIVDSRSGSILKEGGNLWVVWTSDLSKVWAYISVHSVVGNRAFFAKPRTTLQIDPETEISNGVPSSQTNLISSVLFGGTSDASALPSAVYNALTTSPSNTITAGFTDIRPEDAKFATCRALNPINTTNWSGLGYGTGGANCTSLTGASIKSAYPGSSATANPVNFNLVGTDPITGQTLHPFTTFDVGAAPITFLVNRKNANGLGFGGPGTPSITDITTAGAQALYNGSNGTTSVFSGGPSTPAALTVVLREPLSGTMNTTEFTTFRCQNYNAGPCAITTKPSYNNSQEVGVIPTSATGNPLNQGGGGGTRVRAIGTGEVVGSWVLNTTDSIGYAFFSFGNVSKIAGTTTSPNFNYGYLTLNGIDPINPSYTNGALYTCVSPTGVQGVCPASPGTSFPNLRNGTYTAWSVLRAVTDGASVNSTNYINTLSLVNAIQANVNSTVPDFVPYKPVGGDPGLQFYRSHFPQAGFHANNGLSGQHESGGDVGGCIEPLVPAPGTTGCHQ